MNDCVDDVPIILLINPSLPFPTSKKGGLDGIVSILGSVHVQVGTRSSGLCEVREHILCVIMEVGFLF